MENIRVMLVDDEILAIEYLRNIIPWEEYGFELVAEATDGKKALEKFNKYHPQIVFVDIRMPVMDGLEFCRRVVTSGIPVKIILLTAYRDFDYARQAIEIGVTNYILKHDINSTTILHELQKAKDELKKEEKTKRLYRQKCFKNLLHGIKIDDMSYNNFWAGLKSENFLLVLLQVDQPFILNEEFTAQSDFSLISSDALEDLELPHFIDYIECVEVDDSRFVVAISLKKVYSQLKVIHGVHELVCNIQRKFKDNVAATISAAVSDIITDVEKIHAEYSKLCKVIEMRIFYGREKIFMFDSIPTQKDMDEEEINKELNIIIQALNDSKPDEIKEGLDRLFKIVHLSPNGLRKVCNSLKLILDVYKKRYNKEPLADKLGVNETDYACWYNISGIKEWYANEFKSAIENMYKLKFSNFSKKIQQALVFIHNNFNLDLSIEQVAREIDISSVYLMKLFQKEVGQTFLEYLTSYRVEIAKKLIKEGVYKIYEISEMVGYKSSQYFSQVFKKLTGKNPLDYRNGDVANENKH